MQGDDCVYAEAALPAVECEEPNGAAEGGLHRFTAHRHWRLVDHLHAGPQHGPVDLQGGADGIREYGGAAEEGD